MEPRERALSHAREIKAALDVADGEANGLRDELAEAIDLAHRHGAPYKVIAEELGYRHPSGPLRVVQRWRAREE